MTRVSRSPKILSVVVVAAIAAAAVASSLGASGRAGESAGGLRATLPGGKGYFVATVRGRTLVWSLAYARHGARASAQIAVGGGRTLSLCARCSSVARGRLTLDSTSARALQAGAGRLLVRSAGAVATSRSRLVAGAIPTLEILAPKPGATISLPAEIGYRVGGFAVSGGVRLAVSALGGDGAPIEIELPDAAGTVLLPDVKSAFLAGVRDLSFRLVGPSGLRLPNAEAVVVVRDVRVQGGRAAA